MWDGLERVMGVQRVAQTKALPEDQQLVVLGVAPRAAAAAGAVDAYLAVQMRKRRAWVPPAAADGVPAGSHRSGSRGGAQAERERHACRRIIDATARQVCNRFCADWSCCCWRHAADTLA